MYLKLMLAVIISCQTQYFVDAECNPNYGPPGPTQCIDGLGYYDDNQWAVCLSKSYIEQKSRGQHTCRNSVPYCWYQCMIEEFGLDEGPVYSRCKCSPGQVPPTPAPPPSGGTNSQLEESCFSPDGTDCYWYRNCLEKKYPCEASGNGYALTYAEKFCNLYSTRSSYFTGQGRNWINAVRKCLQVALVPLIRPWESPSCDDIRQKAFESHTPCYLEPFPNEPSICDLDCRDWAQVFWTIKGGFTDAFVESLKGTVQVMLGCGTNFLLMGASCPTVILKLGVVSSHLRRKRREVDGQGTTDQLAGDVTKEIAKRLNWDRNVMDWFAYASDDQSDGMAVKINVLLGDKTALGLTPTSNASPKFSLETVTREFGEALESSQLYDLPVGGGTASVSTLEGCEDIKCNGNFIEAKAGPPPKRKNFAPSLHDTGLSQWLRVLTTAMESLIMATFLWI